VKQIGSNIVSFVKNLPRLIANATDFSQVWRPFKSSLQNAFDDAKKLAEFERSELAKRLRASADETRGKITNKVDQRVRELRQTGDRINSLLNSELSGGDRKPNQQERPPLNVDNPFKDQDKQSAEEARKQLNDVANRFRSVMGRDLENRIAKTQQKIQGLIDDIRKLSDKGLIDTHQARRQIEALRERMRTAPQRIKAKQEAEQRVKVSIVEGAQFADKIQKAINGGGDGPQERTASSTERMAGLMGQQNELLRGMMGQRPGSGPGRPSVNGQMPSAPRPNVNMPRPQMPRMPQPQVNAPAPEGRGAQVAEGVGAVIERQSEHQKQTAQHTRETAKLTRQQTEKLGKKLDRVIEAVEANGNSGGSARLAPDGG